MSNKESKYLTKSEANALYRKLSAPIRFEEIIDGTYVFQKAHNSVQQVRTPAEQEFELRLNRIESSLDTLIENKKGDK